MISYEEKEEARLGEFDKTYFPSRKIKNYQASPHDEDFPLGFSGLIDIHLSNRDLPLPDKHPHHKSLLDWQNSPCVSNIEKRIISAMLFHQEFQKRVRHGRFHQLSDKEVDGVEWVLTEEKDFLMELEETYGRMSRRRQKALDVLQNKQIAKTWEARNCRGERTQHRTRKEVELAKAQEKGSKRSN